MSFLKIILFFLWIFVGNIVSAVPDDGNRGSGTTITTVSTPSGTRNVVTEYNTNDGSTVTTSLDSSGNVTVTRNPATGSSPGSVPVSSITSSDDDDDDVTALPGSSSRTTNSGGSSSNSNPSGSSHRSFLETLSPVSTIFSSVSKLMPNSIGLVNVVINAVNRTSESLANRYVQVLEPSVVALGAGITTMGRDMGSRPIPEQGTDAYKDWRDDVNASFYRGVDRSYREQNVNPATQVIPNGPMNAILRREMDEKWRMYDPRGAIRGPLSDEEAYFRKMVRSFDAIDAAYRNGRINIAYPGDTRLITNPGRLTEHQRYGMENTMIVQVQDDQTMENLSYITFGDPRANGYQSNAADLLGFPGGFVVARVDRSEESTYGDGSYEDVVAHELNHAADTAIYEVTSQRLQDPDLSPSEREELEEVFEWAEYARYGCATCPESKLTEAELNEIPEVVRERLSENFGGYFQWYTEIRAFSMQYPTRKDEFEKRNGWIDRVTRQQVSPLDDRVIGPLTLEEAQLVFRVVINSQTNKDMNKVLEKFVTEELQKAEASNE